jgi:ribonuclease T2
MQPLLQQLPGPQRLLQSFTGALSLLGSDSSNSPLHQEDGKLSTCPLPELSCKTQFDSQDTCCFNYPGGHFEQTQFWDADPAVGPDDSWTIHGLWYVSFPFFFYGFVAFYFPNERLVDVT